MVINLPTLLYAVDLLRMQEWVADPVGTTKFSRV